MSHTGEKLYDCNQCNMIFQESDKLIRHMKIHNGEKPPHFIHFGIAFSIKLI